MLNVLKKHYFCIIFLILLLGSSIYLILWYRDINDNRSYPLSLSKESKLLIDYKTSYISKHTKCFKLEINIKYDDMKNPEFIPIYSSEDYSYVLKNDKFFSQLFTNSKLAIKIFKDKELLVDKQIYVNSLYGSGQIKILNENYRRYTINGYYGRNKMACYVFSPNSNYQIVVTNLNALEIYKEIPVFFEIRAVKLR
ncbi:hypothetical protein RYD26_10160 [Pasteurellaceae bacterium LIM206]|nr:hypothetical protein [Pasteurellaceae bacterium LIM206]